MIPFFRCYTACTGRMRGVYFARKELLKEGYLVLTEKLSDTRVT